MAPSSPTRSGHCLRQQHPSCPHFAGIEGRLNLWRPRRTLAQLSYVVCDCDCHAGCPLSVQQTVSTDLWRERCTCAGAARVRESRNRAEELQRDVAAVAAEMRSSSGWGAEELERRLADVYRSRGEAVPPGLTGLSRLVAASNARKGTRASRLLWRAARAIGGVVQWAWSRPNGGDAQTEHNRGQARAGFRSVGVMALVAAIATVSATRASGWPRRLWVGAAIVVGLATGWAGVLVTGSVRP
jgi:hypothetical protein